MKLIKDNWIWIAAPIVIFLGLAAYLYFTGDGGFGENGEYDLR